MKIGIMQPYFIPYIGYWQLINAVDKYVIYDDVNYIKRGWINRNRILVNGEPVFFNIPLLKASQNKLINEIHVMNDPVIIKKNLNIIHGAYKKAPYFNEIYPLAEKILNSKEDNIAGYVTNSIQIICDYLDIKTNLIISSSLKKDNALKGQDKILKICELLDATEYINAIGGRELYSSEAFAAKNIKLKFLKTGSIKYKQFKNEFQPNLSVLDLLMFNSQKQIKEFMDDYTLIDGEAEV